MYYVTTTLKQFDFDLILKNNGWFYAFQRFIDYLFPSISSWFLVAISIDRFLSICKSTKFLFRKKIMCQIIVSSFIIVFSSIHYMAFILLCLDFKETESYNNNTNMTSNTNYMNII